MSTLATPTSGQADGESTVRSLQVFKDVCHKVRTSLLAGKNEIVSPTTITRALVSERQDVSCQDGEAPSAESPVSAMEHTTTEESCPFLEAAEGWSIEYSGSGCEVFKMGVGRRCYVL